MQIPILLNQQKRFVPNGVHPTLSIGESGPVLPRGIGIPNVT
jgi:hypothetical protein